MIKESQPIVSLHLVFFFTEISKEVSIFRKHILAIYGLRQIKIIIELKELI